MASLKGRGHVLTRRTRKHVPAIGHDEAMHILLEQSLDIRGVEDVYLYTPCGKVPFMLQSPERLVHISVLRGLLPRALSSHWMDETPFLKKFPYCILAHDFVETKLEKTFVPCGRCGDGQQGVVAASAPIHRECTPLYVPASLRLPM